MYHQSIFLLPFITRVECEIHESCIISHAQAAIEQQQAGFPFRRDTVGNYMNVWKGIFIWWQLFLYTIAEWWSIRLYFQRQSPNCTEYAMVSMTRTLHNENMFVVKDICNVTNVVYRWQVDHHECMLALGHPEESNLGLPRWLTYRDHVAQVSRVWSYKQTLSVE